MGLAVLPARLKNEMQVLAHRIVNNIDLDTDEVTSKHKAWAEEFLEHYENVNADNIDGIITFEVGKVFSRVLEDAGIFKRNEEGRAAFERFVNAVNNG